MNALAAATKPTVALVRGLCFGGGVGLAMTCDIRLARDDARFRVPAGRLGLGYGYNGVRALVQRLGPAVTADLMFSARIFEAEEAGRLGLVNQVWSAAEFDERAAAYLGGIAANAPLTLAAVKRALIELARPEAERDVAAVDLAVAACFDIADYREVQAAFREKRAPRFRAE